MNLIARLPEVAALIYRCTFHDGSVADYDSSLDYSGNFARMVSAGGGVGVGDAGSARVVTDLSLQRFALPLSIPFSPPSPPLPSPPLPSLPFPSPRGQLGYDDPSFDELMRLYLTIHSDHEGGNASAHATHLVGSTLSDAYLSFSGGMNALAGPLHGLANQEVLRWIQALQAEFAVSRKRAKERRNEKNPTD